MSFSDYKTIAQVQTEFQIVYREAEFIHIPSLNPSDYFLTEFEFNRDNIDVYTSEAARSETIIFPVLREVYKQYYQEYALWIQKSITYDEELSGTPDYMIATRSPLGKTVLEMPIVIVAEAKKSDFEQGWGQCLAELVAAQKLNQKPALPVYGIVTDGKLWEFGKLAHHDFIKNETSYTIDQLAQLLGAIQYIFELLEQDKNSYEPAPVD